MALVADGATAGGTTTCGAVGGCSTNGVGTLHDSVTLGLSVFGGYAVSDELDLGSRLLGAPALMSSGGPVVAGGPSVRFHPTESLTIGAGAMFGDATFGVNGYVSAPRDYRLAGDGTLSEEVAVGGGFELAVRLTELSRCEIVANALPFFFAGPNGSAYGLLLGVAYRFQ
ncbi:MAG: hypothetical protein KF894_06605 [Labilithrix sp.]|nr:hypothetical protein [Labilithrix sp.]